MGTSDTSEWNFNLLILIVVMKLSGYIKELLEDLNEDREVSTPYGNDLFEIDAANSDLLSSEEKEKFHSTVARIMYLAKRVRPDILTTCSFLASRVMCPTQQDDKKLKRLVKYLAHTQDLGIRFHHNGAEFKLEMYIDASYASHSDRI
jgi:thiamine kinase-like enzyme